MYLQQTVEGLARLTHIEGVHVFIIDRSKAQPKSLVVFLEQSGSPIRCQIFDHFSDLIGTFVVVRPGGLTGGNVRQDQRGTKLSLPGRELLDELKFRPENFGLEVTRVGIALVHTLVDLTALSFAALKVWFDAS